MQRMLMWPTVHVTACRVQLGHLGDSLTGPGGRNGGPGVGWVQQVEPTLAPRRIVDARVFLGQHGACRVLGCGDAAGLKGVDSFAGHAASIAHPLLERKQKWVGGRDLFFGVAGIFSPIRWQTQ